MTPEQLQEAKLTLMTMRNKISLLMNYVSIAYHGRIGVIDLTAGQIDELKAKYTTEKEELPTLYATLP